jgi:hypothetical protein
MFWVSLSVTIDRPEAESLRETRKRSVVVLVVYAHGIEEVGKNMV